MAQFLIFLPKVLKVEAGYQALANDSGNYNSLGHLVGTNRGISAQTYEGWIKRPPTAGDMRAITVQIAQGIYKTWYWDKLKGDLINDQSVAEIIVDHAVNAGSSRAGRLLQGTLNQYFAKGLTVDGIVGNATITATNGVAGNTLFNALKAERAAYYRSIGGPFLAGWLNRLEDFVYEKKK